MRNLIFCKIIILFILLIATLNVDAQFFKRKKINPPPQNKPVYSRFPKQVYGIADTNNKKNISIQDPRNVSNSSKSILSNDEVLSRFKKQKGNSLIANPTIKKSITTQDENVPKQVLIKKDTKNDTLEDKTKTPLKNISNSTTTNNELLTRFNKQKGDFTNSNSSIQPSTIIKDTIVYHRMPKQTIIDKNKNNTKQVLVVKDTKIDTIDFETIPPPPVIPEKKLPTQKNPIHPETKKTKPTTPNINVTPTLNQRTTKNEKNNKGWSLEKCIQYALDNNLQIKISELNERLATLIYYQSKNAQLPNLNGDFSLGRSFGKSVDITSNQFIQKGFTFNSLSVSSQTLLFGWFQKKYQIQQNELEIYANNENYQQLKDDIALNIATGYLRTLLAREQVNIAQAQLELDNQQLAQTHQLVNSGKLPELNLYQMVAQVANDSATYISTVSNETIALLELKAIMNINFETYFDVQNPSNISPSTTLQNDAETIYETAVQNQHKIKYNNYKLLSAEKNIDIAKALQYPQLTLNASAGTNFSSTVKEITGQTYIGEESVGYINIAGNQYPLTTPKFNYTTRTTGLIKQYGNNLRQSVSLGIGIPIFNGFNAKTNIEKAKIGYISQQYLAENDILQLKQTIYKTYQEAKAANNKYYAALSSLNANELALNYALKRYAIGMITTLDYITTLNNVYKARSNALSAKYDSIFKQKILEYYMNKPLKL